MPHKRSSPSSSSTDGGDAKRISTKDPNKATGFTMLSLKDQHWLLTSKLVESMELGPKDSLPVPNAKCPPCGAISTVEELKAMLRFAHFVGAKELPSHVLFAAKCLIDHFSTEVVQQLAPDFVSVFAILRGDHYGPVGSGTLAYRAATEGCLWVFKWACSLCTHNTLKNKVDWDWPFLAQRAAASGCIPILAYIHEMGHDIGTNYAFLAAVFDGHMPVVQWLHDKGYSCVRSNKAFLTAVKNGRVALMEWLRDHGFSCGHSNEAIIEAIRDDRVDSVQWLLAHKFPGRELVCEKAAFYAAPSVLEWGIKNLPYIVPRLKRQSPAEWETAKRRRATNTILINLPWSD